jgi:hypothetical protein
MKIFLLFIVLLGLVAGCSLAGREGEITNKIRSMMNDPDSFQLLSLKKTYSTDCNDLYLVSFKGKNSFNGTVTNTAYAIYKNGSQCSIGDWDHTADLWSGRGVSRKDVMDLLIAFSECDCQ